MTLHADWIEWVFAWAAVVSAIVTTYSMKDSLLNTVVALDSHKHDPDMVWQSYGNLAQEIICFVIAVVMLSVGWEFLFLEPPPPAYYALPQSLVGLIGYIILALLLTLKGTTNIGVSRRVRRRRITDFISGPIESPTPIAATANGGTVVTTSVPTKTTVTTTTTGDRNDQ
jgi:hypothetical protein